MPPRILIIGFGLMGGSAGLALRARGWHVAYVDARVPFEGRARDAADEKLETPCERELTLLATHLDGAVALLPQLTGTVTSLCSLMRPLRAVGTTATFVAGHPMAGSHRSGIEAADARLYEGRPWFLDGEHALVERMVRDCGALPQRTTAAQHDEAMALVSQLPQILSTALAAYLRERDVLGFAGPGLRDFLRLAGSNGEMWAPILEANRDLLQPHVEGVMSIVRALIAEDARGLFEVGNEVFDRLTVDR